MRIVAAVVFGASAVLLADPLRMFPPHSGNDTALFLLLLSSLILLGVQSAEAVLRRLR